MEWTVSRRVIQLLIMPLAVMLMGGCEPADTGRNLTIVYSGSLLGELEPCGCTREGDLGGLRRQATAVDALRADRPDLVLISAGGLFSTLLPTHRITNRYILSGFAELGYDAVGLQWGDLAYGTEYLRTADLPLVASNWLGDEFLAVRPLSRGGQKLAYFQWLPPEESPYRRMLGEHVRVTGDVGELATALAEARTTGAVTVLGTSLRATSARERLPLKDVDVLVLPARQEQFEAPARVGRTLVLTPGSRGQRLGRVDLALGPDGSIVRWEHEVIPLPESVPDSARMAPWYEGYTDELKQDYAERVSRDKQAAGESAYLGSEGCSVCHGQAHGAWKGSEHARAFSSLEEVDKSFDANCIGCHTVGFGEVGGFVDPEISGHLLGVGCEACHGPGKPHAASGGSAGFGPGPKPGSHTCAKCHNRVHSPSFRFETYWPRVQHGRETSLTQSAAR